jgi:hypothetical protein
MDQFPNRAKNPGPKTGMILEASQVCFDLVQKEITQP